MHIVALSFCYTKKLKTMLKLLLFIFFNCRHGTMLVQNITV